MSTEKFFRVTPQKIQDRLLSQSDHVDGDGHTIVTTDGHDLIVPETELHQDSPPLPNPEPYKQRVWRRAPRNWLKRLLLWKIPRALFPKHEPTPEEILALEEKKRRELLEKTLRDEAKITARMIVNTLNRLERCYRYKKSEKDFFMSGIQEVKFDYVIMQPDALYFRVDIRRLPRGVSIRDLFDELVLTDLSIAVGRRVSGEYSDKTGAWFIVERATGVLGIPDHVKFQDMMQAFPASADGLTIPLGMTVNARPVYKSLGLMYSMLIGGTIGSGKSNMLNVILSTLIRRNPPDRLKLLLVDLKGGLEFSAYEGVPHLLDEVEGGIIYYRKNVPDVLSYLIREGERRIELMRKAGYKDIGRYNQYHRRDHLPHLVFVIDEWGDVKLDAKIGRDAEEMLTNIAQRFRAVGIHVILCTQMPKSEVVSTRVKAVLPARLAFSTPTIEGSKAIIDNGHARGLNPPGRCVFQWQDETMVQTPYINERIISDIVRGAITGEYVEINQGHDVTPLEVMTWALENDNGYLSVRRLFEKFGPRGITRAELLDWLQSWEDHEFVIGSSLYRVEKASGSRARRLVPADVSAEVKNED